MGFRVEDSSSGVEGGVLRVESQAVSGQIENLY